MKNYFYKYEGNNLSYYIEKFDNYVVTHIFMDNPYEQVKIGLPEIFGKRDYAKNIINLEINKYNLQKSGLVGVNCSGFITKVFDPQFLKVTPKWNNTPVTPLVINNGEILRDFTNLDYPNKFYTYGITKDNRLEFYDFDKSDNELVKEKLLEDGIKNTFGFKPILIYDGEIIPNLDNSTFTISNNLRNAIGEVTKNYYILITVTTQNRELGFNINDLSLLFKKYGCINAYNLDGGRSINYFYKKDTEEIKYLKKSKRMVSDIIYFKEK